MRGTPVGNKWMVKQMLGHGGFGAVFLAVNSTTFSNAQVALKVSASPFHLAGEMHTDLFCCPPPFTVWEREKEERERRERERRENEREEREREREKREERERDRNRERERERERESRCV